MPAVGDIIARVVDDSVRADGPDHVALPVLHTPVTSAPYALAICTANVPTPPEVPMTRTCWPACSPWTAGTGRFAPARRRSRRNPPHAFDVRAPAQARLGVVHRFLDLLVGRPERLGRLGVEQGAVVALGLGMQPVLASPSPISFLYLFGISVWPSSIRLKICHPGASSSSGIAEKKCGTRPSVSLMSPRLWRGSRWCSWVIRSEAACARPAPAPRAGKNSSPVPAPGAR